MYTGILEGTDDAQCGCGGCMCLEGAQAVDGTCQPVSITVCVVVLLYYVQVYR